MSTHVCPWWLAYTFDNPLRRLVHEPRRIFAPYVKEGMTVADIGCGFGFFSIGLARLVKESGRVLAVDIQRKMLEIAAKRALKAGVPDVIDFRLCDVHHIRVTETLDFALAFWMLHETPDMRKFLEQVYAVLKPGGLLLVAEPGIHVSSRQFGLEVKMAETAGFRVLEKPFVRFSSAVVLEKM